MELPSTGIDQTAEPSEAYDAAVASLRTWPKSILAGILGVGAGFAAMWLTTVASLFFLTSGTAELPSAFGPVAVGIAAGTGTFVGVSRSLRRASTDEHSIWNRPPGLVFGLTVWLVCLWTASLLTDRGDFGMVFLFLAAAIALLALGVTWLVRLLAVLGRGRFEPTVRSITCWLLGPAAVIALMLFGSWDGTTHLRFEVSESALTNDAQALIAEADEDVLRREGWLHLDDGRRVGVLHVDWVDLHADCPSEGRCDPATVSVEYTMHSGFFATDTYVYSPAGRPEASTATSGIEHLGGPWWYYEFRD